MAYFDVKSCFNCEHIAQATDGTDIKWVCKEHSSYLPDDLMCDQYEKKAEK